MSGAPGEAGEGRGEDGVGEGRGEGRLLLAFDTSTPIGSVAVALDGVVLAGELLVGRAEHAARLLPAVDQVLSRAGVERRDVKAVVVGEGPGSFTGVRVAAATAKGLARALGVPLWPVSSLAAAAAAPGVRGVRYALFDARGDRVYAACYRVDTSGVTTLVEPHASRIDEVASSDLPADTVFVGDGSARHRGRLAADGWPVSDDAGRERLAEGLLRCVALGAGAAVPEPAGWEPRYVRASSAERMWSA